MAPAKIIICCDGTNNSDFIEGNNPTNVTRIARGIARVHRSGARQLIYYRPGIGTDYQVLDPLNSVHQAGGLGSLPPGTTPLKLPMHTFFFLARHWLLSSHSTMHVHARKKSRR